MAQSAMPVEAIGVFEALGFLGAVLSIFWVNGLLQAITPIFSAIAPEKKSIFFFNAWLVFSVFALIVVLVLALGGPSLTRALTGLDNLPHISWFLVYIALHLPSFIIEYLYLLQHKPAKIVLWGLVSFILQIAAVAAPLWSGYGLEMCIKALALLGALKWLWTFWEMMLYSRPVLDFPLMRQYLRFAWPLAFNVFIGNLVLMFDQWLVGWWYRDEAVFAIFRFGAREFPLTQALATALGVALLPRLTQDLSGGLRDMKAMTRKLWLLLFPVTAALMLMSKPLFPFVFNPAFADSALLFNIYLLTTAGRVLLPNAIVLALGAPRVILGIGMLELALKVGLGFWFIACWGLPGLAFSAVAAFAVEKIGLMAYLHRVQGIRAEAWMDWRWYFVGVGVMVAGFLVSIFVF